MGCLNQLSGPAGLRGAEPSSTIDWYVILYHMSITATEARARLFPLIEEVNADQKAVEIISKRGTAYLVPADEYESWQETMYLLSSPRNAERLRESIAHARAGEVTEHELIEP